MKRNMLLIAAIVLAIIVVFNGCSRGKSDGNKKITVGFVSAGPDDYYNVSAEVIRLAGKARGWDVIILNSEYVPEKEISNVEDLIARGVDGILIIAANTESAQTATQRANAAKVPIVFVAGGPAAGPGIPDSFVTGNWRFSGQWHGGNLNKVKPDAKVALAQAVAGQDIGTLIDNAFKESFKGQIVSEHYCNWSRSEALEYAQNLIASGIKFDVVFAYNEEMAAGVKQALEENGYKPGDVWILSNNGKDIGLEMLKQNWMQYTIEFAPTTEAYIGVMIMEKILEGKKVNRVVDNLAVIITAQNTQDAITWDPVLFVNTEYTKMDLAAIEKSILAE